MVEKKSDIGSSHRADMEHIRYALSHILEPGNITELRVPHTKRGVISGYFDDSDLLIQEAARLSGIAAGVYFTINPVNPELLARSTNRVIPYVTYTTADTDILKLNYLPIDIDSVRPSGISSTDAEHEAALRRAAQVVEFLLSTGFPQASLLPADSGNGGHVLAKIDLPNTPDSVTLLKSCLQALDLQFSDQTVKIDLTTFNPARIWKVYGTLCAKGENTPGAPC